MQLLCFIEKIYQINFQKLCIFQDKALNEIPKYKSLLKEFISKELIDQKEFVQMYGGELKQGSKDSPPTEVITKFAKLILV